MTRGRKMAERLLMVGLLMGPILPAASEECERFQWRISSPAPQLAPKVSSLNVRKGPGTDHGVVVGLPRGHTMLVHQVCGQWAEIETDRRVRGEIVPVEGWVYVPLTCTPGAYIQMVRRFGVASQALAPQCGS